MPKPNEINCMIIEDEPAASRILETYIARIPALRLAGTFTSVEKALAAMDAINPRIIFLDINLPGVSGIQFARSSKITSGIIFTTAYSEYAVESFELDVIDYLLKPISFERFTKAVNRYLKRHAENNILPETADKISGKPFIIVTSDRRAIKIILGEIVYLEAQRNYLLIHTEKEIYRIYQSISEMEEKLPEGLFVRVHRSFIISMNKVKSYSAGHVVIGEQKIPIGRVYARVVADILNR